MSAVTDKAEGQVQVPEGVNIEIDGVAMAAPKGSMIIQAADKAGIPIPRFCYHDKLSRSRPTAACAWSTSRRCRSRRRPAPRR
jgi:NADH-quinone oxidoreductase subunit G